MDEAEARPSLMDRTTNHKLKTFARPSLALDSLYHFFSGTGQFAKSQSYHYCQEVLSCRYRRRFHQRHINRPQLPLLGLHCQFMCYDPFRTHEVQDDRTSLQSPQEGF